MPTFISPQEEADKLLRGLMEARAQLFTDWQLAVQYENRNLIDLHTQTEPWVSLDLIFSGGGQADMNPVSTNVAYGQILLGAYIKQNQGSVRARRLLDFFRPVFEKQDFTGLPPGVYLSTFGAFPSRARDFEGWECYPLVIPLQLRYV